MYDPTLQGQLYAIIDFDSDGPAKRDFQLSQPLNCKEIAPQALTLWLSSGGTSSVLHADDAENFLMLLDGTKHVMLVHQDEAQKAYAHISKVGSTSPVHQESVDLVAFPAFANISWLYGELNAGDTLYIPHTYWHQVKSFNRNAAANLWWGHKSADWRWWDPSNSQEYDTTRFGQKSFPKFEGLKGKSPEKAKCTELPPQHNLNQIRFVDEGAWKQYIMRKRQKASRRSEL